MKNEELSAGNVFVMCVPIFSGGSWVFIEPQTAVLGSYKGYSYFFIKTINLKNKLLMLFSANFFQTRELDLVTNALPHMPGVWGDEI